MGGVANFVFLRICPPSWYKIKCKGTGTSAKRGIGVYIEVPVYTGRNCSWTGT